MYGPDHASRALTSIARGAASFDARADLEHHLLSLLREHGVEGVSAFLTSIPTFHFESQNAGLDSEEARFVAVGPNALRIVVDTFLGPHSLSVNVTVQGASAVAYQPDPRHRAFYGLWETMLGLSDTEAEVLDRPRRAVFNVALLEAEVMNGGLGQYLSNTEGVHLDATLRSLDEIGASRTASILIAAVQLCSRAQSYVSAWDANTEALEELDAQFMATGEDLAALTAERFLSDMGEAGSV